MGEVQPIDLSYTLRRLFTPSAGTGGGPLVPLTTAAPPEQRSEQWL
eukprot:COSAG02_NODE_1567_length_11900_cov_6.050250_7_plen_46_part_00